MPSLRPEHVLLHVDKAELAATLALSPEGAADFEPGSVQEIVKLLRDKSMVDVDEGALRAWAEAGDLQKSVKVAAGVPAVNGEDGYVVLVYEQKEDVHEAERESVEQVDYRNWNALRTVAAGDEVARQYPPTAGTPGRTVFGEEIPAKDGRTETLRAGKSVESTERDGGTVYTSTIDGLVEFRGGALDVSPVYLVRGDVDLSVGNITFNGDVVVMGEVHEGFELDATGKIEVRGSVDKSELTAGGDIEIGGTIYGKADVWVRAQGDVRCGGAENANVEAQGDVYVRDSAIQSHLVGTKVYIGHETNGYVRGGTVEAVQGITVGSLGSPDFSIATILEIKWEEGLIRSLSEFKKEHEKLGADRINAERQLLQLRRLQEHGTTLSEKQLERMEECQAQSRQVRERETELHFLREELGDRVEASRKSAITILGDIHPDGRLVIHGKKMAIDEPRGALQLTATKDGLNAGLPPVEAAT